jgi:hypothetical protein
MVLVGEKSLQQQVLQAVPENGGALAPFETAGNPKGCLRGFFTQVQTELLPVISTEVEKSFAKQTHLPYCYHLQTLFNDRSIL